MSSNSNTSLQDNRIDSFTNKIQDSQKFSIMRSIWNFFSRLSARFLNLFKSKSTQENLPAKASLDVSERFGAAERSALSNKINWDTSQHLETDGVPGFQKLDVKKSDEPGLQDVSDDEELYYDALESQDVSEDEEEFQDALEFQNEPDLMRDREKTFVNGAISEKLSNDLDTGYDSGFEEISSDEAQPTQDLDELPGIKYDFESLTKELNWAKKHVMKLAMGSYHISGEQINQLLKSFSELTLVEQSDFFAIANLLGINERISIAKMIIDNDLAQNEQVTILKLMAHGGLSQEQQVGLAKAIMNEFNPQERTEVLKLLSDQRVSQKEKVGILPMMGSSGVVSKEDKMYCLRQISNRIRSKQTSPLIEKRHHNNEIAKVSRTAHNKKQ